MLHHLATINTITNDRQPRTINSYNLSKKVNVKKGSYIAHLLRWHIETPLYSERSGTVRVYLGSHCVTCHPHTFIRNGMRRTWEFTSAIFNQQSPTDLLVATNLPTNGWMTGLVGLRLVFPEQSPIQVLTAPSAA